MSVTNATATKSDPLIGRTLGGCHIASLLGQGAMGAVYKATQLSLDRTVAFKTIRTGLLNDEQFFKRFHQEARTVSRFSTPHVVQIHEVGVEDGVHFLIMEYASGGNLQAFAKSQPDGRLAPEDAARFLGQCALGLLEAERLKIVHRDIKPENLLLDHRGRVKITDFGIAKVLTADVNMTMDASILGTPLYMSPEQALGKKLDSRSDIYSLGASFFNLLTAKPTIPGKAALEILQKKVRTERLSPTAALPSGTIPPELNQLIERMTALSRDARPASFREVVNCLTASDKPRQPRPPQKVGRGRWRWLAALFLIGIGGLFALPPGRDILQRGVAFFTQQKQAIATTPRDGASDHAVQSPTPPVETPNPTNVSAAAVPPPESPSHGVPELTRKPPPAPLPDSVVNDDKPKFSNKGRLQTFERDLARLRDHLRRGPSSEILAEAKALPKRIPFDDAQTKAFVARTKRLAADCTLGLTIKKRLAKLEPLEADSLEPPFDGLTRHVAALGKAAKLTKTEQRQAGPELRAWRSAERDRLTTAFRQRLGGSFHGLLESGRALHRRFGSGDATTTDLDAKASTIEASVRNIAAAFPRSLAPQRSSAVDFARHLRFVVMDRKITKIRAEAVDIELDGFLQFVRGVRSVSDWRPELGAAIDRRLPVTIRDVGSLPASISKRLSVKVSTLRQQQQGWKTASEATDDAFGFLRERRLGRAWATAEKARELRPQDPIPRALAEGIQTTIRGFDEVASLNLAAARRLFHRAVDTLGPLKADDHAKACVRRVSELINAVRNMAQVRGGTVRVAVGAEPQHVAAFYIDRWETTIREFRGFVEAQRGAGYAGRIQALWPSEEVFRAGARVPDYLDDGGSRSGRWPIEEVSYYQARAYLLARRKDLPTLEEWWLSAKGALVNDRHRIKHPVHRAAIHKGRPTPTDVSRGGPGRVAHGASSIHHIVGNVAEWLKAGSPTARTAELVGGRYLDDSALYFTGARRDRVELHDTRRGYGFRGVLRPSEFLADVMPVAD